jgi:thiamine pyrophosphokinase
MKPDYEYIIDILNIFIESEKPILYIGDFDSLREEDNNKFCFNILIMKDKGILEGGG